MGTLNLTFAGICSHFLRSGVPELPVPHRVVLPWLGAFRFGLVDVAMPQFTTAQPYYVQPHFAFLKYDDPSMPAPDVKGIMTKGYLYTSCRITVLETQNPYDPQFDLYHLSDYIADFAHSADVVLHGRASCYFDIDAGTVTSAPRLASGPQTASAEFFTSSRPTLRFTPLGNEKDYVDLPLDADSVSMTLYNAEVGPTAQAPAEDAPFDFLLHYETAQRGAPPRLTQPAPGMTRNSIARFRWTKVGIRDALVTLADVASASNIAGGPDFEFIARVQPTSLSPSCSNSQYP